jgi:uncharacterized protein
MTSPDLRIKVVPSILEIPAAQWDACANPSPAPMANANVSADARDILCDARSDPQAVSYNPFLSHDFLAALELSNSVSARAGWQPQHLLIEGPDGEAAAVAPTYLKSHSRGEYVFDRGWAEAYERAGGNYYPKVQVAVPFTPATGRRLLVRPGPQANEMRSGLAAGLAALCRERDASSAHVTFLPKAEWELLGEQGFLQRTDRQFHWENAGYGSFDQFLEALASRKRKVIRRERRDAMASDISIHWLTGSDLTESVWDTFFNFYIETGSRKWGRPYLTREFYSLIGERMADKVLLVMAKRAGRWIAGAINFIGSDTLFGRHWGAVEHHPFLHFEVCYYQAIDYAIAHKLACVEAGAQGEHKLFRGYLPKTTYSAHYIVDPGLRRAIADYLKRERVYVEADVEELEGYAPFRKDLTAEAD